MGAIMFGGGADHDGFGYEAAAAVRRSYVIIAWLLWTLPLTDVCLSCCRELARLGKSVQAPASMRIMPIG
jgi:hypothetical protein